MRNSLQIMTKTSLKEFSISFNFNVKMKAKLIYIAENATSLTKHGITQYQN